MSFSEPNYTMVPNDLFDMMADMGEAELKVALAVIRMTIGYHREKHKISKSLLQSITGMSGASVITGTAKLIEKDLLIKTTENGTNCFALNLTGEAVQILNRSSKQPVQNLDKQRAKPVQNLDTLNKDIKESNLPENSGEFSGVVLPPPPMIELPFKPKEPKPKKANPLLDIALALADICHMDFTKNKGRLFREATHYRSDEVPRLKAEYGPGGDWYTSDWRGKQGMPPNPATIRETWGKLKLRMEPTDAWEPSAVYR